MFIPTFGPAIVMVQPGKMKGSGPTTINGKKICVEGDEAKVAVAGCTYMTPQHLIPGTGTLKIAALAPNQKAKKTKTGGKAVLLKGGTFTATFEVQNPAKQPATPTPIPDATPQYSGNGNFMTKNTKFQGS